MQQNRCGHLWRPLDAATDSPCVTASAVSSGWRPYQAAILRAHHGDGSTDAVPAAERPWAALGCNFTFQFLAGLRALLALLHSPTAGQRLRAMLAERIGCDPAQLIAGGVRGQPVEVYPVRNRRLALDAMASLLAGGIDGMLSTMEQAKMGPSSFRVETNIHNSWS